ncbi:MAG: hypothetical protein JWP61_1258 [Friedmanniella sp.]|nr:hypothetical protein [Friedmanniella sp.]
MRLQRQSLLPCPVERLAPELRKPELLNYISWPMIRFVPVDPPVLPPTWSRQPYRTDLRIGGRLSIGEHTLDLQPTPEAGPLVWHDAGFSGLIRTWDHQIDLEDFHGMTRYTDRVEIHAGALTVPAWLFAWVFYAHRQRRLNRLVASGFDYAGAG